MTTNTNEYMYKKSKKPNFVPSSSNKSSVAAATTTTTTSLSNHNNRSISQKEPKENLEPITPDGIYLYDKDYTHFVVHCNKAPYNVYVGRYNPNIPSTFGYKYGNPFVVGKDGDRNTVVKKYRDWIFSPEQDKLFKSIKTDLKGKILACWCSPLNCHGFILSEIANNPTITNENYNPIANNIQTITPTPTPTTTPTLNNGDIRSFFKPTTTTTTTTTKTIQTPTEEDFPSLGNTSSYKKK